MEIEFLATTNVESFIRASLNDKPSVTTWFEDGDTIVLKVTSNSTAYPFLRSNYQQYGQWMDTHEAYQCGYLSGQTLSGIITQSELDMATSYKINNLDEFKAHTIGLKKQFNINITDEEANFVSGFINERDSILQRHDEIEAILVL